MKLHKGAIRVPRVNLKTFKTHLSCIQTSLYMQYMLLSICILLVYVNQTLTNVYVNQTTKNKTSESMKSIGISTGSLNLKNRE